MFRLAAGLLPISLATFEAHHTPSGCPCRLLLLDRIEAGRLAAQERERREEERAAAAAAKATTAGPAAAAALGQSQEPSACHPPDAKQVDLPAAGGAAAPVDATATVAAGSAPGGTATLRRLDSTASKRSQEVLVSEVLASTLPAATQNGHIKYE